MSISINKDSSSYKVSIIYLILLFIVAGVGWFTTRYLGDKARQEILQFNKSTILTNSSHFTDEFEHIEREVRVLSGSPLIGPALISRKDEDIANANSALDRYNSGLGSSVCYLMDNNGITIASSNRNDPDSFVGKSYQFRPYFIQASKNALGSYFALGITSLKRGFYSSYSVKDGKGQIVGVVAIKKDIDEKETDLIRHPYFFLVDPNGIIFLSSRKDMIFKSLWPISTKTRHSLLESGQFGEREFEALLPREVLDGMDIRFDGQNYLASRKVINPEGWSLVIMTSTERIVLYELAGVVISMWLCTLIVVPMIINYRTCRSAEMVHVSEARYRELFDNTSSGVAIYEAKDGGKDFVLKDLNKAGERIDGVRKEDIIGKSIREVRPGIEEFGLLDVFERVWRTGMPEHHPATFYQDQKIAAWYENFVYKLPTGEMVDVYDDITDRKRTEEALRLSERRLRRAEVVSRCGNWEFIPGCDKVNASEGANIIYGLEGSELSLSEVQMIPLPEYSRMLGKALNGLVEEGKPYNVEFKICRPTDGKIIDIHSIAEYSAEKGVVFGVIQDITERKRAEAALREREDLYRTIVSLSPDAITVADLNGLVALTSPRGIQMFGDSPDDELLGRSMLCWVAPEEQEKVSTNIRRLLTEGTVTGTECILMRKDGTRFIGEVNASVIYSADGSPTSMMFITRDITERKLAEDALCESEERFSKFFRSSPVGTSITRFSDGRFADVNNAFLDLFGYTREEVISQNTLNLGLWANPEDRAKMFEILQEQGGIKDFESKFRRKSGEIRDALFSAEVIEAAGEKYVLGLTHDITERKRGEEERKKLEAQLFQAQKIESIGRLAGGVAHDFNNMLGVIIGRAEMALNTDVPRDKLQLNLQEILNAGLRSADLTRQLLGFARKQTAIPKILDLNGTISDMLNMLRRLIGEDMDLLWAPGLDLWKIKIDPSQVDQILANLVVNASDAISGVGTITIRTENVTISLYDSVRAETPEFIPGHYVLLTVSDSGVGMSQEVRENIFEPFFTTKEVGKGTGLGLSTVYGIVKQNEGFIYVASEPGKGTTFKIYLPQFEAETNAHVPNDEAGGELPTGTETILLVEDDEAILNLSKMILENQGYTVLAAQSPADAIRLAEERPGDLHLLITDVVMPEMHGRDLAEQLGAIRPNLKCLYMSGYTADVIAHRGIVDEGVNFIQKPFLSYDFAARVRQVLGHL